MVFKMKNKLIILSLVFLLDLIAGTSAVEAYYMMGYGSNYGSGYYNSPYNSGYYSPYSNYGFNYGGYGPYGNIVRPVGLFRARYYSPFLIGRAFDNLEYDRISDFALTTQTNTFRFINSQNNIRPNQIYY